MVYKVLVWWFLLIASASAAENRFIIPASPAATFDQIGRLFARYMSYVPQNMPGASGVIAANTLYRAPSDGTVIGIVHAAAVQAQALGESAILFDAGKFSWIGSPSRDSGTLVVWHTSKARSFDDLLTTEVTVGVSNIRQLAYVRLANQMLGAKFKIVRGYPSGAHIQLAMERGEIDSSIVFPWSEYIAEYPTWIRDRKIIPIAQTGINRHPALRVPLFVDLSPIFAPLAAIDGLGRPLALPPGASIKNVKLARDLFSRILRSPEFLADAQKIGLDLDPVSGEELGRLVRDVLSMPKQTVSILKEALKE